MEDNNPVAAAPATEANPQTTAPAAPEAAPQPAPEAQPEQKSYFTPEQLSEMEKFVESNGGYEKAWAKMKGNISARQPQPAPAQTTESAQPQPAPEATQPVQPTQPDYTQQNDGTYSMQELAVAAQFERYAKDPKYASIADDILGDKVLKDLADFHIDVITKDGRFNDKDIRRYLDLYAATKPAKPTSTEPAESASMPDELSNIQEVTTMEEANRIQLDDIRRRNAGQPGNPLAEKAKAFVKDYYAKQAKNR